MDSLLEACEKAITRLTWHSKWDGGGSPLNDDAELECELRAIVKKHKSKESKPRNIHNNPSGKNFCCHIPCGKDATWFIEQVGGSPIDDYTESCDEHLAALITLHGPEALVYTIESANKSLNSALSKN